MTSTSNPKIFAEYVIALCIIRKDNKPFHLCAAGWFFTTQAEIQMFKSRRFVACYYYLHYLIGCQPQSGGGIRASKCGYFRAFRVNLIRTHVCIEGKKTHTISSNTIIKSDAV